MLTVREVQKEATRKRILDSALDEFSRLGYGAASLVGIARTAGITHAAIYRHFPSKLAIFGELLAGKRQGRAPNLLVLEEESDPVHALYQFAVRWLGGFSADEDWWRLTRMCYLNEELYLSLSRDRDLYAPDPEARLSAMVERLVRRLDAEGRLRPGIDPVTAAAQYFNILKAILARRLLEFEPFAIPLDNDVAARAALGTLLVGDVG